MDITILNKGCRKILIIKRIASIIIKYEDTPIKKRFNNGEVEFYMKLKTLIKELNLLSFEGSKDSLNLEISEIIYDSRKARPGCLFVCLKGHSSDGHKFVSDAVANGAVALLVSDSIKEKNGTTVIQVNDTRKALALISAAFFSYPARQITTIGITGTKGKTTCACMIRSILENSGIKTGMIGTLGVVLDDKTTKIENTTPESYEIQKYLRKMVDNGCECAVIEASSLGLKWHRLDSIIFNYGVFTNFSLDHIGGDEHKDVDEYLTCKSILFKKCHTGILNIDDQNLDKVLENHSCRVITFGFSKNANFIAEKPKLISKPCYLGVNFELKGERKLSINVGIPGNFSIYNALAATAVCCQIPKVSDTAILYGLSEVKVKGRVEPVPIPFSYTLLIDYAHNALSMKNVLTTLREYNPKRLIVLFGAGGNRPKMRRYEMGKIAGKLADLSVLTADNSRYENVLDIIEDILIGMKKTTGKYVVIPDRKEAIKFCIENAEEGDIVVLAGKGHEDYQDICGIKYPFDERDVIASILKIP